MSLVRIATVTATGHKYIIQQIEFSKTPKVHCWGEVCGLKNLSATHEGSKTFLKSEVTISEVERTQYLMNTLFQQNIQIRRDAGHVLTGRKNIIDHGVPKAKAL